MQIDDMYKKLTEDRGSVQQLVRAELDKARAKTKEKNRVLKKRIAELELALAGKLPQEKLDEHRQATQEFMTAVSNDVSSFNRVIHSFEDKIAEVSKKVVRWLPSHN